MEGKNTVVEVKTHLTAELRMTDLLFGVILTAGEFCLITK